MARMIPPLFDEATTSAAERTLYYKLQDGLGEDWTVIHSLAYLEAQGRFQREGECDFLLLHPRHGLLVIEAKSGSPNYDGKRKRWVYNDGHTLTDPYGQAMRAMHYLVGELRRRHAIWVDANLAFGFAVAFPDARNVVGNLPLKFDVDMLMLEPALDNIQRWVIGLLGKFKRPLAAPVPGALASALAVLAPSFNLTPALKPMIAAAHREFVRLSGEQVNLQRNLADHARMIVRGGAGTGKTMLLSAVARQEADAGKSVLVLCFNQALAAELARNLEGVTVFTFHELCREILQVTGRPAPAADADRYWDKLLPDAALAAVEDYEPRFREIMVDEGQDFQADWWLLVEAMLDVTGDNGWLIFCDEQQNLYDRRGPLPFTEPDWELFANRRNTAQIAAYVRAAIGLPPAVPQVKLPDGPEPVIHRVTDAEGERQAVRQVLHELVHEQGVAPEEIVILDPHVFARSSFAEHPQLGNLTVRPLTDEPAANTIRHATVNKFKGLEADCVLLVGVGAPSGYYHGDRLARLVYVGGSRARVVLHIFQWADWQPDGGTGPEPE